MDIKLSSVEDSSADSPPKGYSTEAWNPPKNWVSPERIALARISAQPLIHSPTTSITTEIPISTENLKKLEHFFSSLKQSKLLLIFSFAGQ